MREEKEQGSSVAPMISIIVPVYNAEKYLHRCIDSILSQMFTDFELLLIDDGSKDKSGVICDEYAVKDSRVRVFHKENGGVSSARNLGLDNARGEWIGLVDSDDELCNLQAVNNAEWRSDLIFFTLKFILHDGSTYAEIPKLSPNVQDSKENYLNTFLHYHICNSVYAKLIRKSVIGDLRFDTTVSFGEDSLFILQLLKHIGWFSICDDVLYIYHRESDYSVKYSTTIADSVVTMGKIFNAYQKLGVRNKIFERNVFNCYRTICQKEWGAEPSLWNNNPVVSSIYRKIRDSFSLSFRIKYRLTSIRTFNYLRLLKVKS